MGFVSLWFLTLFLPGSLLVYALTPKKGKNLVLLLISLLFYSQLEMFNLVFMLGSVTIDYALSRLMQHFDNDNNMRRRMLIISMIKNLGIALIAGTGHELSPNDVPLGMYIYLFSALGYLIDVYKGDEVYEKNYVRFALYCTMFPRIVAGPMFSYNSFRTQLNSRIFNLDRVSRGFTLFVFGFAKRALLLPELQAFTEGLLALYPRHFTAAAGWILIPCVVLCYYYAFSSWCDMAQGLGIMFGFNYPSGFDYPLASASVSAFLLRFNGSVTSFVRKYVTVQLSADPNGMASAIFNLLISSMLVGMWYSMNFAGILWGIYVGILLVLEQCVLQRLLKHIPDFFRRVSIWLLLFPAFLILISPDAAYFFGLIRSLFGISVAAMDDQVVYLLQMYGLPLLVSVVLSMPLLRPFRRVLALPPINRKQEEQTISPATRAVLRTGAMLITAALLVLSVMMML